MGNVKELFDKYPFLVFAFRIILAGICGFAIGLERYMSQKSAGVRTHTVVCCASALFMIVSIFGFNDVQGLAGVREADPSRIAAQVVTGISFLGAGMIFRDKEKDAIKGLTTAAGIWSTAAIGLAIGGGLYFISVFVTVFLIVFMLVISKSRLIVGKDNAIDYRMVITVLANSGFSNVIEEQAKKLNAQISRMKIEKNDDGTVTYKFNLHVSEPHDAKELSDFMEQHSEIKNIYGNHV